jgi:hypothetical protein
MLDSDLPANFWEECMDSFAYCWNRFPTSKTGDLSPYELYLDRKPYPVPLLPLGCLVITALPHVQEGIWRTGLRLRCWSQGVFQRLQSRGQAHHSALLPRLPPVSLTFPSC